MKEHTSTTFNWEKFKEASLILARARKENTMIGSNEDYWKEYHGLENYKSRRSQSVQAKKARLVQSGVGLMPGIDPEESFNTVRGVLISVAIVLAIGAIVWLVT